MNNKKKVISDTPLIFFIFNKKYCTLILNIKNQITIWEIFSKVKYK